MRHTDAMRTGRRDRVRFLDDVGPTMPIIGSVLLAVGYVVPFRSGGGTWQSLALGLHGPGFPLGLDTVGSLVRTIGTFALLLTAILIPMRRSMRALPIGVVIAGGALEGLFFLWLVSAALRSPAPWLGLFGSVVLLVSGRSAFRRLT